MIYFRRWPKDLPEAGKKKQTEAAGEVLLAGLRLEYGFEALPAIAREEHGKPYFQDISNLFFNYSHCRAGVLCGISRSQIGVDAETARDYRPGFMRRVCHPRELEFLASAHTDEERRQLLTRLWTAKESYLKYTGEGMRTDLRLLDMTDVCFLGEHMFRGCFMRFWTEGDAFLCACAEDGQELFLQIL